jgi:nucleoid-associated protein YgaU
LGRAAYAQGDRTTHVQNLLTGVLLIAVGALAVAVLLFHQLAPPLAPEPPPSIETDDDPEDEASVVAVVGSERNPPPTPEDFAAPPRVEGGDPYRKEIETDASTIVKPPDKHGMLTIRVGRGETLSSLAKTHLGDASLWRSILEANPSLTRAEDLQEGQSLRIPLREGR